MLKISLLLSCGLFWLSLNAQKLNTKDFGVDARYQQLPVNAIHPAYTTYQVNVDGDAPSLSKYGYTLTEVKKIITLDGYNRVGGGGSIEISVTIGSPGASKLNLNTEEKANKEGAKWKEYTYFHDVSIAGSYKLMDHKGNTIDEKAVSSSERISTSVYRTLEELKAAYNKEYPAALNNKLESMLSAHIHGINSAINYNYGYTPRTVRTEFETLQTKEHSDFPKYEKIKGEVEAAFATMTAQDNLRFIELMQSPVDFWIEQEKKYDPNNKDERKMNFSLRANLANAYFWMGDYENAAAYYSKIAQGEVSANAGKNKLEDLNKYKAKLKALNRTGQHTKLVASAEELERSSKFDSEREALYAAGDVRQFEDFDSKLGVTKASRVENATMFYKNGTREEGYLVYESSALFPDFRQPKYVRFGKAVGRSTSANSLDYETLDSMRIKGELYHIKTVQLVSGILKLKLENAVVQTIKDYRRSSFIIVHPPFLYAKGPLGSSEELQPDVFMWHKERDEILYTDGLLGFTKAMTKNVEDCPSSVNYLAGMKGKPTPDTKDDRINNFQNSGIIMESLRLYDDCTK